MPQISETYASPGLRIGLLLQDHPDADYDFKLVSGDELGIPEEFGGGDRKFCLCEIRWGTETHRGWKPAPNGGSPDEWNILCTKALGRALKRAGYPDDTKDLKALVLWRQRSAEIESITAGTAGQWITPSAQIKEGADPTMRAIEAAGTSQGSVGADDRDGNIDELRQDLTDALADLPERDEQEFADFCEQIGVDYDSNPSTLPARLNADQIDRLLGWIEDVDD